MPAEEARENNDSRPGIRDTGDAESRLENANSRAGDSKAQTRRYVESSWSDLFEARRGCYVLSTVCRAPSASQLSRKLCATAATSASSESTTELRDRISGEG